MCYDDEARPPIAAAPDAASGQELVLTSADGTRFATYVALPRATATAQVIILPDIRGLHQFYKELALRFAEAGIAAIAFDYFGRTAGLTSRAEGFEFMPHVQQLQPDQVFADVHAAAGHLAEQDSGTAQFTVGFCLGGTYSFLCGTQELGLAGVVGFYAGLARSLGEKGTLLDQANTIRTPALGLFGGNDQGIPTEQVEQLDQTLDTAGVDHTIIIYPGATHSFFDRRATEFAEASTDAWQQVHTFIAAHGASAVQLT